MKKALLLLFGLFLSITIINHINGKSFSVLSYIENISTISDIERPQLPTIDFKTYKEFNDDSIYFTFDESKIPQNIIYWEDDSLYLITHDRVFHTEYIENGSGEMQPHRVYDKYTLSFYEEHEDLRIYMKENSTNDSFIKSLFFKVSSFFSWLSQPITIVVEFIQYILGYVGYIFKCITKLTGGLIL